MPTKRKTLTPDLEHLTGAESLPQLQAAMTRCIPNAVDHSYYKQNIFCRTGVSEEFARWLLEYGADLNFQDAFGYTPLCHLAMDPNGTEQMLLYLKLGADIHLQSHLNGGPLHGAADHGRAENIRILLEHGADVDAGNHWGSTPLEFAMGRLRGGVDVVNKIEAIQLLIDAGSNITEKTREQVVRIGTDVEFRRANMAPEWLPRVDAALERLYTLFDVPPVPKRRMHDGVSPITVTAKTWTEQYQELWDYLVPGSGPCKSVQGEVIRINGRVSHEILDNGGGNWDGDFRKMLKALGEHLETGNALSEEEQDKVRQLIGVLQKGDVWENELNDLCRLSVQWVLSNPDPIPLGKTSYRR